MLADDLRHSLRVMRAAPGFTAATTLVLALGIGATTATFTVVHTVLVRPLPFERPDLIVRIWSARPERDLPFFSVSAADFADWRARARSFAHIAAYERERPAAMATDEPEQVLMTRASREVFDVLGVHPSLGRWFSKDEDAAGDGSRVAVISHGLWQRRFGGRHDAVGQPLRLNGEPWTVVGVMPPSFTIPNNTADVWVPLRLFVDAAQRSRRNLRVIARLHDEVPVERAAADLQQVAQGLAIEHPSSNSGWTVTVVPLAETVVGEDVRRRLWLAAGAVGLVLLITCVNVSGLLLARATTRAREMAVRLALGARRVALVRQLLVECLALSLAGGAMGVILAMWWVDALAGLATASIPRGDEIAMRPAVMAFALLATMFAAIASGLVPALRVSRGRVEALGSRSFGGDRVTTRLRDVLVAAQAALATVLIVIAGLLINSFIRLQQRDLGFDPSRLVIVQVLPPASSSPRGFHDTLSTQLAALPGVSSVAGGSSLPYAGPNSGNQLRIEGRTYAADEVPDTDRRIVTPEYFRTLGIQVVRGRTFTAFESASGLAAIISTTTARRYFDGADPMGQRVRLGDGPWLPVVGVVADVQYFEPDVPGAGVRPMVYIPSTMASPDVLTIAIRTTVPVSAAAPAIRATVRSAAPAQPITRLEDMEAVLAAARGPQRFNAAILGAFAWIALVLAATGLWGLIAQGVAWRRHEFGVRIALGARPNDILRGAAFRGIALASAGIAVGVLGAISIQSVLQRVLYDLSATDPATLAASVTVLLVVATLSSIMPARRALQLDPTEALRAE
ncbi:MAG: ABC transporter permease [Acidobacteria bacterium]|nr:ABC transporter permease [Acidobacteriota bacterium]